jgi:hypothetical protein
MIFKKTICKKMSCKKTTCDKYEGALLLAAASNDHLDAKLARHLERCSTCRMTLHSKSELLARIDSALRVRVNEGPRPCFLVKLRLQFSKEPTARPASDRVWHGAGAALALALIVLFYPLVNRPLVNTRQASVPTAQRYVPRPAVKVPQSTEITQSARAIEDLGLRSSHHSKRPAIQSAGPQEPEVLVPPDEQKAFAQFVACLARREPRAQAVVTPATNKTVSANTELPQVSSVDLADLQLADLQLDRARQNEWINQSSSTE